MKTYVLAAALLAVSFTAAAGNSNSNPCGNNGNNCDQGSPVANGGDGGNGYGGDGTGVGIGVGVGLGGNAAANAVGQGGAGGSGGAGGNGGAGGVGIGHGGDASAGVIGSGNSHNSNKNDATALAGANSDAKSASLSDAKSVATNGGNTLTGGPTTVGGQAATNNTSVTMKTERNAPPVFLGAITPTSCGGSFNAGGSSRDGAGGLGFSWVGTECAIRMIGDRYQGLGMIDTACEVYKSTKAFKEAAKRNPKLASLDCKVTAPVVPAPLVPQAFLEARTPRG